MSNALEINQNNALLSSELKLKQFVLCNDCFWCASALSTRKFELEFCPQCHKPVSAIPLASDEKYTYSYDERRGVEVDFQSIHR